jgi:hypothetical protein
MTATYSTIDTYTFPSNISSYTFTSIPQTYTDLILVCNAAGTGGSDLEVTFGFNSINTNSVYSFIHMWGDGTNDGTFKQSVQPRPYIDYYGGIGTTLANTLNILHFMNYSNTTTNKTVLIRSSQGPSGCDTGTVVSRSTDAINQIRFKPVNSSLILAGSTLTLYGIKAK